MPPQTFLLDVPVLDPALPRPARPESLPAASAVAPAAPVPVPLTRFLGRDQDLARAIAHIAAARLVTLTGPGGVGKTRLAIAAAEASRAGRDDVAWVGLAEQADPHLVPQCLAAALGVREEPGRGVIGALVERLRSGRVLLILDNCEHLLHAIAELAQTLLSACEQLHVLGTSRQPLGISGEVNYAVPLLAVPEPGTPPQELVTVPAVDLLLDRARAARPDFALTPDNAAALAALCRRLDGVPLAIELAAARLRLLSVDQVNSRLEASSRLLSAPGPGPAHHRSLQATMDWSYSLLSEAERAFFAQLSVFAGGFDLDAAEQVAGGPDPNESLDLLSGLVDKSLVLVADGGRQMRYRLLETVRQYAADKLPADDGAAVRRSHVRYYTALAERAEPELCGSDSKRWLDALESERDNLRAALSFAASGADPQAALRLASASWRFCYLRGHYAEGRSWLRQALAGAARAPEDLRAKALTAAGTLAHLECEYDDATAGLESALDSLRRLGDRAGEAAALQTLGGIARERGQYERSRRMHEESLALSEALGDEAAAARSLNFLGFLGWLQGDLALATARCTAALGIVERIGDREGIAWSHLNLGAAAYYGGDQPAAGALVQRSLELSTELGHREGVAWCLHLLGRLSRRQGETARAQEYLRESLELHRELGDRWRTASVLADLAALAGDTGQPTRAVSLFAAARALWDAIGAPIPQVEREPVEAAAAAAAAALDEASRRAAEQEGRTAPLDRLLAAGAGSATVPGPPVAPGVAVAAQPATSPPATSLQVRALGSPRVLRGGQLLGPGDWGYAKPRELLYYLLDAPDRSKEQIGADLWPWASPASLRNSFHATLHALRRALGRADWIVFRAGRYAFNRSLDYSYDVERFATARASAAAAPAEEAVTAWQAAIRAYGGDYLPDLEATEWIEIRRAGLRQAYESALFECGRLQVTRGDLAGAIETYQRAVAHDNLLETAHRELVRCYARAGERGLAVRHGRALVALLRDELGVPPGPETAEVLRRLRQGEPV